MATSLLDDVHALMTAPLLSATARSLGASEETVAAGLVGSSAAMLAALAGRAGEAEGIGPFFKLITGPANNGSVLQEPRLAVATSPQSPLGATAGRFLSGLFRSQLPTVANTLAQSTGLRPGSGGSLLSIAAPLVLGVLGNRVRSEGLDAAGLAGQLAGDRDRIMRGLPGGLTSIPALGSLFDLNDTGLDVGVARSAVSPRPTAARTRRLLPVLSVLALAVLLWGLSRSGGPPGAGADRRRPRQRAGRHRGIIGHGGRRAAIPLWRSAGLRAAGWRSDGPHHGVGDVRPAPRGGRLGRQVRGVHRRVHDLLEQGRPGDAGDSGEVLSRVPAEHLRA